jgi:hypothetical protein
MEVKNFLLIVCVGIGLILGLAFIVPYASAYPYVIQGQTINQSETYDMTSVYGWTGKFAHWDNAYDENSEVTPSQIVDLNKMTKTYAIYIDPSIWVLGRWYQYDGKTTQLHGNNLAFVVNRTQPGVVPKPNATPQTTVAKPTQLPPTPTNAPTIAPLPTPVPTVQVVATQTFPPPRSLLSLPSSPFIPGFALLIIGLFILMRDRHD